MQDADTHNSAAEYHAVEKLAADDLAKEGARTQRGEEQFKKSEEWASHDDMSRPFPENDDEEGPEIDHREGGYDVSEEEVGPSPFQPVAGVQGKFPPGWEKRHERSESPQDHWHRKL